MTIALHDRIRLWRLWSGRTQRELAAAIGVSREALSQWESETTTPRYEQIVKIVAELGIDMRRFFGAIPKPPARRTRRRTTEAT